MLSSALGRPQPSPRASSAAIMPLSPRPAPELEAPKGEIAVSWSSRGRLASTGRTSMSSVTRRDALKLGGGAAASTLLLAARARAGTWKPIPIGTQLWCVRQQLSKDIPGTLKALGAMGYEGVELENAFGRSGAEWKGHLDAARLKACGFHHTLAELSGDRLAASVEFNQAIGNRNLIIRSLSPAVYTSADLLKKTADEVNAVAERLKAAPDARRVPQPHDGLQSHRRRVLVEPLRRPDVEGRDPAVRHRQRLRDGGRDAPVVPHAQRRAHGHDARQAVLEEGPERLSRRRRARLAGDPEGRRGRRAASSGTSSSTRRKASRRSRR